MAEIMTTDVRALLDRSPFDHSAVADLREVLLRIMPASLSLVVPLKVDIKAGKKVELFLINRGGDLTYVGLRLG